MNASQILAYAGLAGALLSLGITLLSHSPRIVAVEHRLTALYDRLPAPVRTDLAAIVRAARPAALALAKAEGGSLESTLLAAAVHEAAAQGATVDAGQLLGAVKAGMAEGIAPAAAAAVAASIPQAGVPGGSG